MTNDFQIGQRVILRDAAGTDGLVGATATISELEFDSQANLKFIKVVWDNTPQRGLLEDGKFFPRRFELYKDPPKKDLGERMMDARWGIARRV